MKQLLTALFVVALAVPSSSAFAQEASQTQKLFEAGKYQEAIQATPADAPPAAIYQAALSQEKLNAKDKAKELYNKLAALPESDAWHFIGVSGAQLLDAEEVTNERDWRRAIDYALEPAEQATKVNGNLAEAYFQTATVFAKREDWQEAADAFTKAATLNPSLAYAHYYAGMAYNRAGRADQMAIQFEQFLKLAPDAPEKAAVTNIMRTVRGR